MKVEARVRRALLEQAARVAPTDRWDEIDTGQLRQTEVNFERGPARTRRLVVIGFALALTTVSIVVVARAFDRSSTSIPGHVAREGMIAFAVIGPSPDVGQPYAQHIDAVAPDGSGLRNLTPHDADYLSPAWSPDGTKLAYVRFESDGRSFDEGIFIANADNTEATKIYESGLPIPISLSHLAWSPDGTKIGFVQTKWVEGSDTTAVMQLMVMNVDGTGVTVLGASSGGQITSFSWSPDSNEMAFTRQVSKGTHFASDLFVMDADGTNVTQLTDDGSSMNPVWSPDGSQIAFEVRLDDYHHHAIYVINVGNGHRTQLTSGSLDVDPVWSPDGSQIAFIRVDLDTPAPAGVRRSSLMIMNADGTDQHAIVTTDEANGSPTTPSWAVTPSPASSGS
jgi:Tol biopolymer transport system component